MKTTFIYSSGNDLDYLINDKIKEIENEVIEGNGGTGYGKVISIQFACNEKYNKALILWEYLY